jgi:hypothetical protein
MQLWDTFVIYINLPKVSDRPLGENLPNLVTRVDPQLLSHDVLQNNRDSILCLSKTTH